MTAAVHHHRDDGRLWLPYGASDVRIGFASVALDQLLSRMVPTGY